MTARSSRRRAIAGFFLLSLGVVLLFGLGALVALRPADGLAWVQVPDLTADLRLDAGLQTRPLKDAVIAEALNDQSLDGATAGTLAVPPALAVAPPPATVALSLPPATLPVTTPQPATLPTATPAPPPAPSATPTPTAPPATPTPTPAPTPSAAPTPPPAFAISSATEFVKRTNTNGNSGNGNGNGNNRCSGSTVTATGSFSTNGVGGSVSYEWVRLDSQGNRTVIPEAPIAIRAGDTSTHAVVSDIFTPAQSGSDQLVFISPSYSVAAQSWSCVG